jgi:hypothetical protein
MKNAQRRFSAPGLDEASSSWGRRVSFAIRRFRGRRMVSVVSLHGNRGGDYWP